MEEDCHTRSWMVGCLPKLDDDDDDPALDGEFDLWYQTVSHLETQKWRSAAEGFQRLYSMRCGGMEQGAPGTY